MLVTLQVSKGAEFITGYIIASGERCSNGQNAKYQFESSWGLQTMGQPAWNWDWKSKVNLSQY